MIGPANAMKQARLKNTGGLGRAGEVRVRVGV